MARDATGVRVVAREFAGDSALAREPVLGEYLADLVRPYGVKLREDVLAAGVGHCYGEMGEQLLADLRPDTDDVDLMVLAHAVPDVRPGRSTALYLSSLCRGRPLAFAVSEQGAAAAFTAVRLIGEILRAGDRRNAVLLVLEQSALHYESDAELPDVHSGVAVLHRGVWPEVHQDPGIDRRAAEERFRELAARIPGDVAVLGPGLAGVSLPGRVVRPAGRPATGVWAALAEVGGGEVVLADYDAAARTLSVCRYSEAAWTA